MYIYFVDLFSYVVHHVPGAFFRGKEEVPKLYIKNKIK